MGRQGVRLPSFCLNRIRPHVRVRSPPVQSKTMQILQKLKRTLREVAALVKRILPGASIGRRIMIVVDSSLEAKGAVQWALTHTVQSQDVVILLYRKYKNGLCVTGEETSKETVPSPRVSEFLQSMKNMCQVKRPEVQIEVAVAEGKEKGPTIVEEAKKQGVALLVLGQKKHSMTWRLLMTWAGNRVGGGVVEHCIQNASCMAIGVRRKSKKLGGYLITTKRHKDFWLLA
ncbi:hypothetical protein HYC85_015630 [Camellia sinensis]|uniref:UspA domain-containing protein n=1 Tax=Camellia sinensis TaxID=4442 RepID=A0A7J7GX98_CAMSI|nr:hypothetical protein HYC85_015630 [Camellia sinensis]